MKCLPTIKITVSCRPHTHRSKRGKSQKVKRTKGQKVTLAVFLERHPGVLPDHAEPRAEDAVRLLPHYHRVACNKYFILHIIHINYHFTMYKSLSHHFISNNSSMGFLLPLLLPDLYTWLSENCTNCYTPMVRSYNLTLHAYGKILHIEYCMQ